MKRPLRHLALLRLAGEAHEDYPEKRAYHAAEDYERVRILHQVASMALGDRRDERAGRRREAAAYGETEP